MDYTAQSVLASGNFSGSGLLASAAWGAATGYVGGRFLDSRFLSDANAWGMREFGRRLGMSPEWRNMMEQLAANVGMPGFLRDLVVSVLSNVCGP